MAIIKSCLQWIQQWFAYLSTFLQALRMSTFAKETEIVALRSQVALLQQQVEAKKLKKPCSTPAFRQLWVILSLIHGGWRDFLALFQPATVVRWHRSAFKLYWRKKSKKVGRPPISQEMIDLIRKISVENPLLKPEKIREKMLLMGIKNPPYPNTIAKYLPSKGKHPTAKQVQSWKTFLRSNLHGTWAMDFFTMPTLLFRNLYVLIIIHHGTRQIIHYAITANPDSTWVIQQLRNATPFGVGPKYLVHDNDPVFVSRDVQRFLSSSAIKSKRISVNSPWQNPYAERMIGILRQELLNHVIPLNAPHLDWLLREYIENYYNPHRTHQGLGGQTPIPTPEYPLTDVSDTKLIATPVLNGLYHTYDKKPDS